MLPPRGGWQGQVVKYQEKFNKRKCSKQVLDYQGKSGDATSSTSIVEGVKASAQR